ncbi:MAG TPA: GNAT family N-acetyltransferase [Candidatus Eisenbacteria bacterium]
MPDTLDIRPLDGPDRERWITECARMLAASEPWITLRRTEATAHGGISDSGQEAWVAIIGDEVVGFMLLVLHGALRGYLRTICLAPGFRGRGLGTRMIRFAEERVFRDHPNMFLCVSSFNPDARRLYERLGYHFVGELTDFIVRGHSELLYRKTRGPLMPD